jgi:hypothetical protein
MAEVGVTGVAAKGFAVRDVGPNKLINVVRLELNQIFDIHVGVRH